MNASAPRVVLGPVAAAGATLIGVFGNIAIGAAFGSGPGVVGDSIFYLSGSR